MNILLKVFLVDILAKLVVMTSTILLIRNMSDTHYSTYTIFMACTNIFSQIAIGSFSKMYIVDYSYLKNKKSTLLLFEIILAVFIAIVFVFIQPVVRSNVSALLLLMVSTTLFSFIRVLFQQQCNFKIFTLLEIIRVTLFAVLLLGSVYMLRYKLSAINVIAFYTASLCFPLLFLCPKYLGLNLFSKIDCRYVLKYMLVKEQMYLFIYSTLMAVLLQIDVLTLKIWSTDYNVSTYSSALKYYYMMLLPLNTINSVLLPQISFEDDYPKIQKVFKQQDKLSLIVLAGIIFSIIIAPYVLPIIDGGKYPGSINVFRVLSLSAILSFWGSPYNNLLIKEREYGSLCMRFFIGIILAILGNYILIPKLGVDGTAVVTLLTYGLVNISSRIHAKLIIKRKINEAF